MIKKGTVSNVDMIRRRAKVVFKEVSNCLSYELVMSKNIGDLNVGDTVIVAFWRNNLTDGAIIAKI